MQAGMVVVSSRSMNKFTGSEKIEHAGLIRQSRGK